MPNRRDASVQTVTCGVDWISATLGREEIDNQTWVYDAIHALEKVAMAGNVYKRRSLLGFDGWESGGCFVGSNETMHYAQFAGHWANDAWWYLEHPKVHISRIDLQVTVQYDIDLPKEGRYQYAKSISHNKSLPTFRQRKIHLFAGSDGGDTIYVGSPTSSQRGRVYNKHKQSGDTAYERSWRYEVVYRNEYAVAMFRELIPQHLTSAAIIIPQVVQWYAERGINILGLGDMGAVTVRPIPEPPSDAYTKLKWLEEQVVPTIRKLVAMGYGPEVGDLLAEALVPVETNT